MSESTTLREAIAEAIFNGEFTGVARDTLATLWAAEVGNFGDDTVWHNQADAVLAVLADPPVEVVERAARALFEDPISSGSYTWAEMVQEDESRAELWRDDACRILKAAFGGEQS